jgi:hypothetical protein
LLVIYFVNFVSFKFIQLPFSVCGMKESIDSVRASAEACVSFVLQELAGLPLDDYTNNVAETSSNTDASADLDYRSIPADDRGVEALKWAVCMVVSRSHSLGSKTGRWLTPILDLANHLSEVHRITIARNLGTSIAFVAANSARRPSK